jgi:hypothetical protein
MLLADEIARKMKNPPWSLVEIVIRQLDPGHFNSFACLARCLEVAEARHLKGMLNPPCAGSSKGSPKATSDRSVPKSAIAMLQRWRLRCRTRIFPVTRIVPCANKGHE